MSPTRVQTVKLIFFEIKFCKKDLFYTDMITLLVFNYSWKNSRGKEDGWTGVAKDTRRWRWRQQAIRFHAETNATNRVIYRFCDVSNPFAFKIDAWGGCDSERRKITWKANARAGHNGGKKWCARVEWCSIAIGSFEAVLRCSEFTFKGERVSNAMKNSLKIVIVTPL